MTCFHFCDTYLHMCVWHISRQRPIIGIDEREEKKLFVPSAAYVAVIIIIHHFPFATAAIESLSS